MKNEQEKQRWLNDGGLTMQHAFSNISADSIVFDVGLHKGGWSQNIVQRYDPFIYGFEPVKEFFEQAVESLKRYPKVRVFNYGLGGSNRQSLISVNSVSSTLVGHHPNGRIELVRVKSIKDVMNDLDIDTVDLIAIDIEGAEYELIDSMVSMGMMERFKSILLALHEHVEIGDIGHYDQRSAVRNALQTTHEAEYIYDTIFELWYRK